MPLATTLFPAAGARATSNSPRSLPGLAHLRTSNSRALQLRAPQPGSPRPIQRVPRAGRTHVSGSNGSRMPCALPARPGPASLPRLWGAGWGQVPPRGARAQETRGGRRGAGWLVLAAPGGDRAGNVACAPGNAPIALAPEPGASSGAC